MPEKGHESDPCVAFFTSVPQDCCIPPRDSLLAHPKML